MGVAVGAPVAELELPTAGTVAEPELPVGALETVAVELLVDGADVDDESPEDRFDDAVEAELPVAGAEACGLEAGEETGAEDGAGLAKVTTGMKTMVIAIDFIRFFVIFL